MSDPPDNKVGLPLGGPGIDFRQGERGQNTTFKVNNQDGVPDRPVYATELEVGHGRTSEVPAPAQAAMVKSAETSVESSALLPAIEGIMPCFVERHRTFAEWEVCLRPAKNKHQDTAPKPCASTTEAADLGKREGPPPSAACLNCREKRISQSLDSASHLRPALGITSSPTNIKKVVLPQFSGNVEDYWEFQVFFRTLVNELYTEHGLYITQLMSQLLTNSSC